MPKKPTWVVLLSWNYLLFAAGQSISDSGIDFSIIERLPAGNRRTAHALFGLWLWREGDAAKSEQFLSLANPDIVNGEPHDVYCALLLGILCFAHRKNKIGERQFDLIKTGAMAPIPGYPFVSLISDLDKAFVGACIGVKVPQPPENKIRDFKGHAWVLIKCADTIRRSPVILGNFVSIGIAWKQPLSERSVADRLQHFQRRLLACAGVPLMA